MKLGELAERIGCRLEGPGADPDLEIQRVNSLDDAGPGEVTFLTNPKFAHRVAGTRASAIIADDTLESAPCLILRTSSPSSACVSAVALLTPRVPAPVGVHPQSAVDPSAEVAADVVIGAFVSIGPGARVGARTVLHPHVVIGPQAVVGEDCVLHAHVSVRDRVRIGDRVRLQDGAVIGSEGFGYTTDDAGTHHYIPQVGIVVIGDDVDIGANTTVDRPAIGETRIGDGTKIDNVCHIAHGVKIGRNVRIAACAGIAGSSVIEDDVVLAGQVGVINHVRVGRAAQVASKSAVMSDLEGGQTYAGIPAVPISRWRRWAVKYRRGES